MYIPRPLVITLVVFSVLVLLLAPLATFPATALLELVILGLLIVLAVSWVYWKKDGAPSADFKPVSASIPAKIEQLQIELENLRRHHRQILLDLPLGVCAIDGEERITLWNRALEKMTGLPGNSTQGHRISELEDPWRLLLQNFVTSSYTHLYKQSYELNGRKRTVNLHKSVIGQAAGEDGGYLILLEDITETENLEAGLTHSERLASIGRLAAGVAHEIGNPITGIACLAQNIRDEYTDADLRQMAKQIVEQTERTSRIVQSLVNFAHAGTAVSNSAIEDISVRDCIEEAITLVSLDKKGKSMSYEVDCDADIQISGDAQRLLQVLLNLINNSRDASQPDSTINLSAIRSNNLITINIEDEGVGIPGAIRDRIFDPFFTTKEAGEGTGLGLSLVYSIVGDLHGNIDIISPTQPDTGRGTRVVLTFPPRAEGIAAEATAGASESPKRGDLS
jgi:PAS domain S-box-containing protein